MNVWAILVPVSVGQFNGGVNVFDGEFVPV